MPRKLNQDLRALLPVSRKRLTARARNVLRHAQDEALERGHAYVGTEHLLLGVLDEGEGVGALALTELGVQRAAAAAAVDHMVGRGKRTEPGEVGLTARAKQALTAAQDEAKRLGHHFVGTEHIVLGILDGEESVGARVLAGLGVTPEDAGTTVARLLAGMGTETASTRDNVITCRIPRADLDAIDSLVEAGVRSTRSDAAAWLIHAGIEANRSVLDRVEGTVNEIRRLREVARSLVEEE